MLSPDDRRLADADAALPGLQFVLDAEAVADWLGTRVPQAGIRGVRARYVRYKPGTSCLVEYDVQCAVGPIRVTAKAFRSPAVEKIARALRIVDLPSALGPGAFVADDAPVAVTVFPHDPQLRSLRHLFGPSRSRILDPLVPDIGRDVAVSMLSYKPERRLVARVEGAHGRAVVRVYSRAEYAAGAGRRIPAEMEAVPVARTIAQHPRYPIVATEWLQGEVGTAVLTAPARGRALGEALARLHGIGNASVAAWTRSAGDDSRHLRDVGNALADLLPQSASRIHDLSRALADAIAIGDAVPVLTHGDFAVQQAVFTADGVALTDLDQVALSDPATDVGSFVADLEYRVLTRTIAAHQATETIACFLAGYGSIRPLPSGIALNTAAQLLRRAALPFRTRLPEWSDGIDRVIDRCESLPWRGEIERRSIARSRRLATAQTAVADAQVLDPAMPWLEEALDPARVSQLFAEARLGGGMAVESARILRHKRGRRCLLRYTFAGSTHDAVIAKTRVKGLDRRTARLNQALHRNGFGEQSADGIVVPRFVGVVPPLRMWVQAEVAGQSAAASLRAGDERVARRLADVFVKLQRHGPQPARTHTIADELLTLDQRLSALAARRPAWRERLARLLRGCISLAGSLPQTLLLPAHRDFYPDQILVSGDHLIVLDLDLYALAHPALDAGNCLAHVIELGMRGDTDESTVRNVAGVLRDSIHERLPAEARPALDVFTTLTLARLIDIDDRLEERRMCAEPLLEQCEARLSEMPALPSARRQVSVPAW